MGGGNGSGGGGRGRGRKPTPSASRARTRTPKGSKAASSAGGAAADSRRRMVARHNQRARSSGVPTTFSDRGSPAASAAIAAAADANSGTILCRIKGCGSKFEQGKDWGEFQVVRKAGKLELRACGDMCAKCRPVFKIRETEGTWHDIADKVNETPQEQTAWLVAVRYASGELIKPWHSSVVDWYRSNGVCVMAKFRGVTPTQFMQIFDEPHDVCGFVLTLLPDLFDNFYQGVLLNDDGTAFLSYKCTTKTVNHKFKYTFCLKDFWYDY